MRRVTTLLVVFSCLFASAAEEAPQSLTLDGRLYSSPADKSPLLDSGTFKIQILDSNGTCVLYEEQQIFDTRSTAGYFNINIGEKSSSTTKRTAGDSGNTLTSVFANNGGTIPGKLLSNNAACFGVAAVGSKRSIQMTVVPDSDPTPRVMDPFALDSVPSAFVAERAESLQGISSSGFIQTRATAPYALSQANVENIFSTTNYTKLTDLLSGSSSAYVHSGANGTIQAPSISGTPSSPAAGQIWYDAGTIKYHDGTTTQTLSAGSGITSLIIGTGLTPTGTISTGGQTIAVDVGTSAGQIVAVQAGGKLPALDGSDLTGVVAASLSATASINTSGTIASGAITSTGALTGTETRSNSVKIYRPSTSNYVELLAPSSLSSVLSFRLPAAMPAVSGYVLSSDTSGNMSWVAQTPAGLSAVSNSANLDDGKIWVGDGAGKAQEITLSGDATVTNAGVLALKNTGTAGTYAKVTTDAQGRVTSGTTLSASDIPSLAWSKITSGTPTTLSGYGITDAVVNGGGTPSFTSGVDASKPAAGTAGRIYIATDSFRIYRDNGTTWDMIASAAGTGLSAVSNQANLADGKVWIGDGTGKSQEQTLSGDATISNTGVLTFKNTGTAGTYKSVTTDAQGRVTGGTNPTTLSGFGITDAVSNAGGALSIQAGVDASKPAAGTVGRVYMATDTSKIYRDNGTTWDTIASNSGTGISALTGDVTASGAGSVAATVARIQGVGVSVTAPTTTGQVLKYNSGGTQYAPGFIGMADIRSSQVGNVQFFPASACGAGQTLAWQSGTDTLVCSNISLATSALTGSIDLTTQVTGTLPVANGGTGATNLTANQLLMGNGTSAVSTLTTANSAVLTTNGSGVPSWTQGSANTVMKSNGSAVSFGAVDLSTAEVTGTLPVSKGGTGVTSLAGTFVLNGGQNGAVTAGTNDATNLTLETNSTARMTINSSGNVGIGTTSPSNMLEVVGGTLRALTSGNTVIRADTIGTGGAHFIGSNARGTFGSPTYPVAGDMLALFQGRDGVDWNIWPGMKIFADENFTASAKGSGIAFETVLNGTATVTERMRITNAGNVGIGTATVNEKLEVNGNMRIGSQTTRATSTSRGQVYQGSTYTVTANANTTLDWNNGNLQEINTFACSGAKTITMNNMKDGAVYTLLLSGTAAHSGTCLFAATGLTFKASGGNVAPTASRDVLFTFAVINNIVIYSMLDNLQ